MPEKATTMEPAATQDWIRDKFGQRTEKGAARERGARVLHFLDNAVKSGTPRDTIDSAIDFLGDNPDADREDLQRHMNKHQAQKDGGTESGDTPDEPTGELRHLAGGTDPETANADMQGALAASGMGNPTLPPGWKRGQAPAEAPIETDVP